MCVPDAAHSLLTDTRRLGHRARAPMGGVSRFILRGLPDHLPHLGSSDGWRPAGLGRILLQPGQAHLEKPLSPASGPFWSLMPISAAISKSCLLPAANKTNAISLDLAGSIDRPRTLLQGLLLVFGEDNRRCDTHSFSQLSMPCR